VYLIHLIVKSLLVTCGRSVVSSTNKTDRHDIAEILLKVALNTITPSLGHYMLFNFSFEYCIFTVNFIKRL